MSARIHYFLAGLSSIFTLFPQPVRAIPPTFEVDDQQASKKDWEAVGSHLRSAMAVEHEQQKASK